VRVDAVKIGMLGEPDIVEAVADMLRQYAPPVVVLDPVMVATSGDVLVPERSIKTLKETLIPMATLVTPNIPEAQILLRKAVLDLEVSAADLSEELGVAVLLKGGHMSGDVVRDVLAVDGDVLVFEGARVDTHNTHGTGCTLSTALACMLAHGMDLAEAVSAAKDYVAGALAASDDLDVGSGHGPLQHFWELYERE
jgi:hydroxymethylpyrimidine/phosphomethylpyrimidine kinase